jgi:dolichol-phosphate mannosyltransferase
VTAGNLQPNRPLLSVVVPVLNEGPCLEELAQRIHAVAREQALEYELIFIDDGSRDDTPDRITALRTQRPEIRSIHFTRSFGHQAALAAGLLQARGSAVVTMDGDLQHPPELIPRMLAAWREGARVVHTTRRDSSRVGRLFKSGTAKLFYNLMQWLSSVPLVPGGADFRLLDRQAVDQFNQLSEHFVFVRGLVPWMGFPSATVDYEPGERLAGASKFGLFRMGRLALDGIFSFSVVPLRIISLAGVTITILGALYGAYSLHAWWTDQLTGPPGWTSLMVVMLIFGGIQLLSIGILAEYVGRIYEEAKSRPRYVVAFTQGLDE